MVYLKTSMATLVVLCLASVYAAPHPQLVVNVAPQPSNSVAVPVPTATFSASAIRATVAPITNTQVTRVTQGSIESIDSIGSIGSTGNNMNSVPITRIDIGNSRDSTLSVGTAGGGFFGADSGSVSNSGVSVGTTTSNLGTIAAGSAVQVGNTQNVNQNIQTGKPANGIGGLLELVWSSETGSIANSGSAVDASFDGGNGFAGAANVGNVLDHSNSIQTGNGGFFNFIGASSGSITNSGASVGQSLTAPASNGGIIMSNVGVTSGGNVNLVTGNSNGFGSSGSLAGVGVAVTGTNSG